MQSTFINEFHDICGSTRQSCDCIPSIHPNKYEPSSPYSTSHYLLEILCAVSVI